MEGSIMTLHIVFRGKGASRSHHHDYYSCSADLVRSPGYSVVYGTFGILN